LQGALSQITGGKFKDGFTAGLASGLAGEVMRGMQDVIADKVAAGQLNKFEQSQYKLLTQAVGSAIRLLANPQDPAYALAADFIGSLVQEQQAKPPAPDLGSPSEREHQLGNTPLPAAPAPAPVAGPAPVELAGPPVARAPAPTLAAPPASYIGIVLDDDGYVIPGVIDAALPPDQQAAQLQ
jgi:hypothetical protein